jgi:hypothetical protein
VRDLVTILNTCNGSQTKSFRKMMVGSGLPRREESPITPGTNAFRKKGEMWFALRMLIVRSSSQKSAVMNGLRLTFDSGSSIGPCWFVGWLLGCLLACRSCPQLYNKHQKPWKVARRSLARSLPSSVRDPCQFSISTS